MKKIILSVLVLLIASNVLLGQQLPASVDNSTFVPPVRVQYWNSCQPYSIAYYLKSYIWNRELGRNPALLENQFNPYFVWNQAISPVALWTETNATFALMSKYGVATADQFPFVNNPPPEYQKVMPSLSARESALSFRSKELKNTRIWGMDSVQAAVSIAKMKDSLAAGVCFTITFPIFPYINQLYDHDSSPAVYKHYPGLSPDSMEATHQAMVVGYDDALQAFKLVNSWGEIFGNDGYFYLEYKWLHLTPWFTFDLYYLYEDFDHISELSFSLPVRGYVDGTDRTWMNNIIVDLLYFNSGTQKWVDFLDSSSGLYFPNLVRITSVNGRKVADDKTNVYLPLHNYDGSYLVFSDLTDYSSADSFSSASILLMDPISGSFNGEVVNYQYQRQPLLQIEEGYVRLHGTNKRVRSQVVVLPDTSVILSDYWSYNFANHAPGNIEVHIVGSTCTFKRYLVSFDISDTLYNQPPVLVTKPDTLVTAPDSLVTFQFEAIDPDGDPITFSVIGQGANIDSVSGWFSYVNNQLGSHDLKILVSDGTDTVIDSFIVRVDNTVGVDDDPYGLPTEYSLSQNYPNPFNPSTVINFSLPQTGHVSLKIYNILGQEVATLIDGDLFAGNHSVRFDASNLSSGLYLYKIEAGSFSSIKKMVLVK